MHSSKKSVIFSTIITVAISFYFIPIVGADTLGQTIPFFTNSMYDYANRNQIAATLYAISDHAYYYVEDGYFSNLGPNGKTNFSTNLKLIAEEFDSNIYPKETALWGSLDSPGDGSGLKVTILFDRLTPSTGGYFDSNNEYPTNISPTSNYRKMIVINTDSINNGPRSVESLISHELQHLIPFNQKELLRSVNEDTWLNELRSEYSTDLVGYNEPFQNSILQRRVREFLQNPSDSLTEWLNKSFEYGAVSLFGKYMVEQYGTGILKNTIQSSGTGIDSINNYLRNNNYEESFEDIFRNWVITNYLNNSLVNSSYAYSDQDLSNIHISPIETNLFYPFTNTFDYSLKPWQPTWYKFNLDQGIPKTKALKVEFRSATDFGLIYIDNFGAKEVVISPLYISNIASLSSFVLSPYNRSKTSRFTSNDPTANLTISISFVDATSITNIISNPSSIPDGALIKNVGGTDFYVTTGPYKRYMSPLAISLYGHLDTKKSYEVTPEVFDSFPISNYIRTVNTAEIYAVWPDNTKHLFKLDFAQSGRNSKLIFTINPREFDIYKTGVPILH